MATFTIRGAVVRSIPSFYDELNRLFMAGEDWTLGPSLDALNDLLYGGVGALQGDDEIRVVWSDHALSREALGRETTAAYYREKLQHPETFSLSTSAASSHSWRLAPDRPTSTSSSRSSRSTPASSSCSPEGVDVSPW